MDLSSKKYISRGIVTGIVVGGVLGAAIGFLYKYGFIVIPGITTIFTGSSINAPIIGTIVGIPVGVIIGGLVTSYLPHEETGYNDLNTHETKIQLHEEQLDIQKKRVQTGKVSMHKEIITEEKNITVPVNREELIIEKEILGEEPEIIRIPIKEEQIEIKKHPVVLEDVSYHIEQFEENQHVEEALKKERLIVKTDGSMPIINKEIKNSSDISNS